jgi:hypothetical protein
MKLDADRIAAEVKARDARTKRFVDFIEPRRQRGLGDAAQ